MFMLIWDCKREENKLENRVTRGLGNTHKIYASIAAWKVVNEGDKSIAYEARSSMPPIGAIASFENDPTGVRLIT